MNNFDQSLISSGGHHIRVGLTKRVLFASITRKQIKKQMVVKETKKSAPRKTSIKSAVKSDVISKLRIRVQAYEYKILDLSVKQIIDTALRYDAVVEGPIHSQHQLRNTLLTARRSSTKMLVNSLKCVFTRD